MRLVLISLIVTTIITCIQIHALPHGIQNAQYTHQSILNAIDASQINSLAYDSQSSSSSLDIDPQIRKALLTVLKRLEKQENEETQTTSSPNTNYINITFKSAQPPLTSFKQIRLNNFTNPPQSLRKTSVLLTPAKISITAAENATVNSAEENSINTSQTDNPSEALFFQLPISTSPNSQITTEINDSITTTQGLTSITPTNSTTTTHPNHYNNQELLILEETNNLRAPLSSVDIMTKYLLEQSINDKLKNISKHEPDINIFTPPRTTLATPNNLDEENQSKPGHEENGVEVFQAPLLTAFTVEQDARGIPQRIIPLHQQIQFPPNNYFNFEEPNLRKDQRSIDITNINHHNNFIQNHKYQSPTPLNLQHELKYNKKGQEKTLLRNGLPSLPSQFANKEQTNFTPEMPNLENNIQQNLNRNENRFNSFPETAKLVGNLPSPTANFNQILWQQSIEQPSIVFQQSYRVPSNNFFPSVSIIPSVPFQHQTPVVGHSNLSTHKNTANFEHPEIIDKRLQTLLQQTGINNKYGQEDLNIVSKVLSLNAE